MGNSKINTSVGADLVNYIQEIHHKFVELCEKFAQKHKFFIIGFDVIAENILENPDRQKYIFNELNEQLFYDISEECNMGTGAPVMKIMWDAIEHRNIMTSDFLVF